MEIQPFAPQTSFDTPNAGSPAAGPKDDLFAQMMERAAIKAAERRPEADKPEPDKLDRDKLDRDKPEAKPFRTEARRWQPNHPATAKPTVDHTPPRSPRADEAHADRANTDRANTDRTAAAHETRHDTAPVHPGDKAVKPLKAERGDTAQKAAKPEQATDAEATDASDAAASADTSATDTADAETNDTGTGDSAPPADAPVAVAAPGDNTIPDGLTIVATEVTVAETTVPLIAAEGALAAAASVAGSAEVGSEAPVEAAGVAPNPTVNQTAGTTTADATAADGMTADTTAADTTATNTTAADAKTPDQAALAAVLAGVSSPQAGVVVPAQPLDPQAPQAADAAAGVPPVDTPVAVTGSPLAPAGAPPAAELTAAAASAAAKPTTVATAPAEAASAATAEAAPTDAKPAKAAAPKAEADAFKLPDTLADLLGTKPVEKAAERSATKGPAEAGKDSGTASPQQPATTTTAAASAAAQTQPAGDTLTATAGSAAVDAITGTNATTAPADVTGNKDPAAGQILPADAVKAAAPTDAPAAFTTLRPARGPNMPMGVPDQVAVNIGRNVAEGNERFTIMLRPDELGRIDIRLEIGKDGRVSALVAVDKPQTLELLQRDARGLERALQDAGLKADSDSLSFSLRDDGAPSFADQREDSPRGAGRRGRGFGGGGDDVAEVAAMQTLHLAPGRVDVRV